jgi:hypothetical protein
VIDTELVPCPDPGDQGACPIRTGDILFDVAVNRDNGNLYAVWQDARFSGFRYDTIAFSQSTNGGRSWSAPVRINAGSDAGARLDDRQAFTPAVHVADDGTVGVTFYDFRNNTAADGILATDQFAVHCHADCTQTASWAETQVTPTSFDMRRAPFARGYFVGDYEGLGFIADDGDATAPGRRLRVVLLAVPRGRPGERVPQLAGTVAETARLPDAPGVPEPRQPGRACPHWPCPLDVLHRRAVSHVTQTKSSASVEWPALLHSNVPVGGPGCCLGGPPRRRAYR